MLKWKAFSLLEISVILIIIGLMTGIVAGTPKLIQNSQDKRVMQSFIKYDIAGQLFLDRFNQMPGDFSDATRYWPSCTDYVDTLTYPCNGNGDGDLGLFFDIETDRYESLRYWQHLALSGYIDGEYIGTPSPTGNQLQPGINAPRGPLKGSSFNVSDEFSTTGGKYIVLFLSRISTTDLPADPDVNRSFGVFTPSRLLQFDSKFDDGLPNSGMIYAFELDPQACLNLAEDTYIIGTENEYCVPSYRVFRKQ